MTPKDFRRWKAHMKFSNPQVAEALGISKSMAEIYAAGNYRGKQRGNVVTIPRYVELACAALALGIIEYNGPD